MVCCADAPSVTAAADTKAFRQLPHPLASPHVRLHLKRRHFNGLAGQLRANRPFVPDGPSYLTFPFRAGVCRFEENAYETTWCDQGPPETRAPFPPGRSRTKGTQETHTTCSTADGSCVGEADRSSSRRNRVQRTQLICQQPVWPGDPAPSTNVAAGKVRRAVPRPPPPAPPACVTAMPRRPLRSHLQLLLDAPKGDGRSHLHFAGVSGCRFEPKQKECRAPATMKVARLFPQHESAVPTVRRTRCRQRNLREVLQHR